MEVVEDLLDRRRSANWIVEGVGARINVHQRGRSSGERQSGESWDGSMNVHFTPEFEKKLSDLAAKNGTRAGRVAR